MARAMRDQRGFVLTIEFILIMTLIVMTVFIGFLYLRGRIIIYLRRTTVVLVDSATPANVIGKVVGYDDSETPFVLFRDASTGLDAVVVRVRPMGFVSRADIFYDGPNCTGNANIRLGTTGAAANGYLNDMQGAAYGVGVDGAGFGTLLYRDKPGAVTCSCGLGNCIESAWSSSVEPQGACTNFGPIACVADLREATLAKDLSGLSRPYTVR